jgi:hypothetical protein
MPSRHLITVFSRQARALRSHIIRPFFSFRRMAVLPRLNVTYRYTCHRFSTWHPPLLSPPNPLSAILLAVARVSGSTVISVSPPVLSNPHLIKSRRHPRPRPSPSSVLFLHPRPVQWLALSLPFSPHRPICSPSPYSLISLRLSDEFPVPINMHFPHNTR